MNQVRNVSNTFSTPEAHSYHRRYLALMASLHALSVEMDAKYFPAAQERVWKRRCASVAEAVRTLIDGQHLAKRKKNEENIFDV